MTEILGGGGVAGAPAALAGATAATRYAGGTTSGPPTSGTFAVGDEVVDETGTVFICVTAGTPGTWVVSKAPDPAAVALGLINWNTPWGNLTNTTTVTSGTIFVSGLWLPFGVPVGHVSTLLETAAAGTAITAGYMGLCAPTKMVAQSASLGTAAASYPAGPLFAALTAQYTPVPADSATGFFYVVMLLNGTFGTTQPTVARGNVNAPSAANPAGGSLLQYGTAGTAQTVLPSNGSAVTIVGTSGMYFAAGAYA